MLIKFFKNLDLLYKYLYRDVAHLPNNSRLLSALLQSNRIDLNPQRSFKEGFTLSKMASNVPAQYFPFSKGNKK